MSGFAPCFDRGCNGCDECVDYDARHIEAAASQMGVDYGEALCRIEGMPQSNKERQQAFRARKIILEGVTEVRGIFLPEAQHAALKKLAAELAQKTASRGKSDGKT